VCPQPALGLRAGWAAFVLPQTGGTCDASQEDLALTAALPVARWVEYQTGVPYIEQILDPPFQLDADGLMPVPTGLGLGVRLNLEAVARYSRWQKNDHVNAGRSLAPETGWGIMRQAPDLGRR
jgi:hypothetical protein